MGATAKLAGMGKEGAMKRIILILIVAAAVGAYFVHGYLESKARKKPNKKESLN